MSKRGSSRTPKQAAHVEVAFGLSAAHHYISGEKPFIFDDLENEELTLQGSLQSVFQSAKVSAISDQYAGPDVWSSNYTYSTNEPNNLKENSNALTGRVSHVQSFDYQTIRLAMSNVSAGGYCLVTHTDTNFSAHIGDLLAIREYNDKSIEQWGVGVIRRMMNPRNGSIELGVQMLTPNAVAIAARLESDNDNGRSSEFMRCLMLPELRTIDQPATIIAPALPFKKDCHIRINLQDKQILASLTQQLERTWSFSQFEFSVLSEDKQNETVTAPTSKEAESGLNFDSLWSSL